MAWAPEGGVRLNLKVLIITATLVAICGQSPQVKVHKRFEYKYTFKPPYLAQKDGSVPFFEYSGNAIASEEMVRITPSLRSQKGMMWTKEMTNFDWWEVEITFRVTGRGRIGADGLAFWYTAAKGVEGPVFGSSDMWIGLGVFFDSFDNDNKHNNPYISAMVNDGSKNYDHPNDGSTQQLAGCLRDFRNKPFPVKARVEYFHNILTVYIHNGMSNNDKDFEMCIRAENVVLPKNGYFGVSAATGGLADDHDVLRFITHSLRSPEMALLPDVAEAAENKKVEAEFAEYQQKLNVQKEDWRKEHPDEAKDVKDDDVWADLFMDDATKELKQIFEGQSAMGETVKALHSKMDQIIGRQEQALSMLTQVQNMRGGAPPPPAQVQGGVPQLPPIDTINRDEVNAVLANQRELVSAARDIKNFVADVHNKVTNIQQNQGRGQGSAQQVSGPGTNADMQNMIAEIRDSLNHVKRDMTTGYARLQQQAGAAGVSASCPEISCSSTTMVALLLGGQLIIIVAFLMYKDNK
jgi:mannose-binding lectin 1